MTPIKNVFGLDVQKCLDFDTAGSMIMSGYSRIPVFDKCATYFNLISTEKVVELVNERDDGLIKFSCFFPYIYYDSFPPALLFIIFFTFGR